MATVGDKDVMKKTKRWRSGNGGLAPMWMDTNHQLKTVPRFRSANGYVKPPPKPRQTQLGLEICLGGFGIGEHWDLN